MERIISGLVLILILVSCMPDYPEYDKFKKELNLPCNKFRPGAKDSLENAYIMRACPGMEGKKLISRLRSRSERRGIRFEDILICAQLRDKQKGIKKKAYNPLEINYTVKHFTDKNGHTITVLTGDVTAAYHDPECEKCKKCAE